jgi:hypothetical protein
MGRQVRVTRLGQIAVRRATEEAGITRRIEPTVHLRGRGDLDRLLLLLLLLLRVVIAPRTAAATTTMTPAVPPIVESAAATAIGPTVAAVPSIAPIPAVVAVVSIEALILVLLLWAVVVALVTLLLPASASRLRERAVHGLRRRRRREFRLAARLLGGSADRWGGRR